MQELLTRKDDEDLECLSQIMRTCGRILDSEKGKGLMNQYFERMTQLADNGELPARIRFMLKDVIELRQYDWLPRKATIIEGPMPINQIRPLEDDRQGFRRDHRNQDRDQERWVKQFILCHQFTNLIVIFKKVKFWNRFFT